MSTWIEKDNALRIRNAIMDLHKTFVFNSFSDAIAWMNKASLVIDPLNHHPERTNVYNKVHVVLRTHDAGNTVTDLDRTLATLLDQVS